jgi:hypothetical protein
VDLPLALRAEVAYALLAPCLGQLEVFHGLNPNQLKQVRLGDPGGRLGQESQEHHSALLQ